MFGFIFTKLKISGVPACPWALKSGENQLDATLDVAVRIGSFSKFALITDQ